MRSPDVIIAGAGIIGISLALELRERGSSVLVLERAEPGNEASSAAAGMLAATDPETPVGLRALALESAMLYPQFVRKLENAVGVQADFRRHGTIALGEKPCPGHARALLADELERMEPCLNAGGLPACFVAEDSIDPVLLMQVALGAARKNGVEVRGGMHVQTMRSGDGQAEVITDQGRLLAGAAVNCCGAWSGAPVKPRKGQMMYLQPLRPGLIQHVVRAPGAYIVPRSSGKILVGATVEDVGFDKTVDPQTIRRLHSAAASFVPELASAAITETWAGLRPGTPDDLPVIGETANKRVFLASGHYRNGILLAPVTARIMANLVTGKPAGTDIATFSPARFATAA
ncbi:MAG TPA: FAD-dependent oxidoreductase [Candidatus Angelobacter sp.]